MARDTIVIPAFVVALVIIAVAAWTAGQAAGDPGEVDAPSLPESTTLRPPVETPFYGFEGLGDDISLGGWGTITDIRPTGGNAPNGSIEIVLDTGESEMTIQLDTDDFVRLLGEATPQTGDTLTTREGEALITR
jgi:hypothetical protein